MTMSDVCWCAPRARPAATPHTPAPGPCERASRMPDRTAPGNHRPITRARACALDGDGEELDIGGRLPARRKILKRDDWHSWFASVRLRSQNVHEEDAPGAKGQGGAQAAAHQGARRSASGLSYAARSLCLSPCFAHVLASPSVHRFLPFAALRGRRRRSSRLCVSTASAPAP